MLGAFLPAKHVSFHPAWSEPGRNRSILRVARLRSRARFLTGSPCLARPDRLLAREAGECGAPQTHPRFGKAHAERPAWSFPPAQVADESLRPQSTPGSHPFALFCTQQKLNSFIFKRFRTLT